MPDQPPPHLASWPLGPLAPVVLTSPSNPRIKRVLKLRKSRERRRAGVFLAEGWREVTRAAGAGLDVEEVFIAPSLLGPSPPGAAAYELPDAPTFEVPVDLFVKMCYRDDPEGVLAVVRSPGVSLASLPWPEEEAIYLVAVGTAKPGNLGAMARTAAAAGCRGVIAAGAYVDPFNPNAIRASTGGVFSIPIAVCSEAQARAWLAEHNIRVMAATLEGSVEHTQAEWLGPLAVVIGPEDVGLDSHWLAAADASGGERVRITMPGLRRGASVDSLNASNAAAVLLFEAVRQPLSISCGDAG